MKVHYKEKSNKNNGKANVLDIEDKRTRARLTIPLFNNFLKTN